MPYFHYRTISQVSSRKMKNSVRGATYVSEGAPADHAQGRDVNIIHFRRVVSSPAT